MKATYIDYKETKSFSSAVIRYIEQDPALKPFISTFPTLEGFAEAINNRKVTADREVLVEVLKEQYSRTSISGFESSAVAANIELLASENTYTVTTGHQLNIFTGPLYFIFKIVTAIKLARDLKKEFPDKNFVPVYWMATEDHDFAEINHTHISGKKVSWENSAAAGATGRLKLSTFAETLKEYKSVLGLSAYAEDLSALIDAAYSKNRTLADATRYLVNALFESYGLVVLDADDHRLKRQFSEIIKSDILNQHSFQHIEETVEKLSAEGIESQVNPREINFFYLLDGLRERLTQEGDRFYVLNSDISFSKEELVREIDSYPERFSPNVVMRPLYQEVILPNLAYIGGGAEVVYWLELKKSFDHYSVDFPILILRNSALIARDSLDSRLAQLGLTYQDLFEKTDEQKKKWVLEHTALDLFLTDETEEFNGIFSKIKDKAAKIDKTLIASTEAIEARLHRALYNLERKFIRAEKRNHAASLRQIDKLKETYFANGLQERSENFGSFYALHGPKFIECLVEAFDPLAFKFTILELQEKN